MNIADRFLIVAKDKLSEELFSNLYASAVAFKSQDYYRAARAKNDRAAKIYKEYQEGYTLSQIGSWHELSSERVRQILVGFESANGLPKKRRAGGYPRQLLPRPCAECKTHFVPKTAIKKYCSLKCSRASISARAKNLRLTRIHSDVCKLLISDRLSGMTYKALAQKYNMSTMTIHRLLTTSGAVPRGKFHARKQSKTTQSQMDLTSGP